jgi:hypothetical protein
MVVKFGKSFQNGKIYTIRNTIDDDIYVGSTCQSLSKRMSFHRKDILKYIGKRKLYTHMNELGVDNFYIELIEECPCDNLEQLQKREGHFIREMATLNMRIAGRKFQEQRREIYYPQHQEKLIQYSKEYRILNPEKVKESNTKYRESHKEELQLNRSTMVTCECGECVSKGSLTRHKTRKPHQYYLKHLEDPTYTVVTPGETCECGGRYTMHDKKKHMKTTLHQNHLKTRLLNID